MRESSLRCAPFPLLLLWCAVLHLFSNRCLRETVDGGRDTVCEIAYPLSLNILLPKNTNREDIRDVKPFNLFPSLLKSENSQKIFRSSKCIINKQTKNYKFPRKETEHFFQIILLLQIYLVTLFLASKTGDILNIL